MRALISCLLLALTGSSACAQETAPPWKWYFAGIHHFSTSAETELLIRSGTAHAVIDDGSVRVEFVEKEAPELKPTFDGHLGTGGHLTGELSGFFPHEPETWKGAYRQMAVPGCRFEEIELRPSAPDGTVLMVSRVEGECE